MLHRLAAIGCSRLLLARARARNLSSTERVEAPARPPCKRVNGSNALQASGAPVRIAATAGPAPRDEAPGCLK